MMGIVEAEEKAEGGWIWQIAEVTPPFVLDKFFSLFH